MGLPQGVVLDPLDAPALAREVESLCASFRLPRPAQILFTAECAIRVHDTRALLGLKRERTLGIGWPLLFVLDADEIRGALALALHGEPALLATVGPGAHDPAIAAKLGAPLLVRTLSRLTAAGELARRDWWPLTMKDAAISSEPKRDGMRGLRGAIEQRGRAGWQPLLDALLAVPAGATAEQRLRALGGADVQGGSHRNVAQALLWEGLTERLTTVLESPLVELLRPHWQARHVEWREARERARELERRRRAGELDHAEQLELALIVEAMLGARAAHALYRDFFARERRPEYALGMARTLAAFDPERARPLLEKLVASNHPLCVNARPELVQLVIASAGESRQTIATVQPISSS